MRNVIGFYESDVAFPQARDSLLNVRLTVEEGNDASRITNYRYVDAAGTVAFREWRVTRITRQIGMDVHIGNLMSTIDDNLVALRRYAAAASADQSR